MKMTQLDYLDKFDTNVSEDWSFAESRSIEHLSHGYHRYPAKFIPQLVQKLIETYTEKGDRIVDVFAGCGTTLVESKVHGRESIGVDINPVAQLITRAKITPIETDRLAEAFDKLQGNISKYRSGETIVQNTHERISYWFEGKHQKKIAYLHDLIMAIKEEDLKDFFLCALSNILKNSSRWLQTSTKPQRDPAKKIKDPFDTFRFHVKRMIKKNKEFYDELVKNKTLNTDCKIKLADARRTGIRANTVNAIITSPPYVTSYEYADIHQLTGYWFDYISDLSQFRKKFIGTFYSNSQKTKTLAPIAEGIVNELIPKSKKSAREVAKYFNDMYAVTQEMARILKPNGVVCLVIGNTTMKDVKIKSAEAFAEMLELQELKIESVIKRKIPFKLIPTIRDKKSGKFTTLDNQNKKFVYPEEFIIVARK